MLWSQRDCVGTWIITKTSIAVVTKSSLISPGQPLHSPHLPLPVSQSVPPHQLLVVPHTRLTYSFLPLWFYSSNSSPWTVFLLKPESSLLLQAPRASLTHTFCLTDHIVAQWFRYRTSLCDFSREYHWVEFDLYPHHLSQCWPHGQHAVNGLHSLSLTWAHAALKRLYRHEFNSLPHHFPAMCSVFTRVSGETIGSLGQLQKRRYAMLSPHYCTCAQQIVQLLSLLLSSLLLAGPPLQIYYWGFHTCVWPWFFLMTFILLDTMRSWEAN